tara:strand:+ start:551 stop:1159 length:609 start_codon:yes stop_codon:yes gene_type:complete
MRLQTTYLIEDITNNLVTTGSMWMTSDKQEYIGQYHHYATGEVYTRGVWNSLLSKKLIPYEEFITVETIYKRLKPNIKTTYDLPTPYTPVVTPTDINKGTFTRYFVQNQVSLQIVEVDKEEFTQWQKKKIDPNIWLGTQLEWKIIGNVNDIVLNGIVKLGIASFNKNSVLIANKILPSLQTSLTNFTQFASDSDFIVPTDIN